MTVTIHRVLAVWCAGLCLFAGLAPRPACGAIAATGSDGVTPKSRVLIVSDGGERGPESSAVILRNILMSTDRFEVRLCEVPEALSAAMVADFELVVLDARGVVGGKAETVLQDLIAKGKGVLLTQRGLGAFRNPDLLHRSVGGAGEASAFFPLVATSGGNSGVHFVNIKLEKPEHPILRGISRQFRVADAVSQGMEIPPGAEVLASVIEDSKAVPVLAISSKLPGRVVGVGLGHDASAMHEPEFRAILARAAEWAATGAVTLAADEGVDRPKAGAVKALLVTGGHDHEVAFYNLFSGYSDLDWIPILPSAPAFKTDPSGKYDVVIMYDFSRDLDDLGKKNLRSFVEKGGGVVVLHHALLNYQTWDWWIDDVVGGSYRLSRTGQTPSSRVKDNQQIYVTPTAGHAITAGIGPFHIQDEAYQLLRMSAKIRPLLTTDNPTSDRNLAWLGPDGRYRVVAIQPGHGHTAFGHPSYRAIVHNAILWAAGKTK
jgi:type 1 glutamine amidotransferase